METKEITSAKEFGAVTKNGVTLVNFYTKWSVPCQVQRTVIKQMNVLVEGKALVAEMNVDRYQKIPKQLAIKKIPTLAIFKNGKEINRIIGVHLEDSISEAIEKVLIENKTTQ